MKKLLASLVVVCMLASGMTAFAEDVPASDADMVIEHEAQGDVMPIAETGEEAPVAEGEEAEEVKTEETAEEAEKAETEATEETKEEAEPVAIDAEKMLKNVLVIDGKTIEIAEDMGAIAVVDAVIFVPVRVALEAMGYQVSWAEKEQMVMGANQTTGAMFIMQLDNPLLFFLSADGVEGKQVMEAAPFKNEAEWRTYVPLGGLAVALGLNVGFDADASVITLSK